MDIFDIILIGLALAMDACALTIANCATYKTSLTKLKEWSMPTAFALFQFLMPILGFYLGTLFASYISNVAGYISAAVFFLLSAKIFFDIIKDYYDKKHGKTDEEKKPTKFSFLVLLIQAVATSIDAFVVGITLAASTIPMHIALTSLVIGAITFLLVALALIFGKYLGKILGKYAEWAGAIILLALAIKCLVEAIIG